MAVNNPKRRRQPSPATTTRYVVYQGVQRPNLKQQAEGYASSAMGDMVFLLGLILMVTTWVYNDQFAMIWDLFIGKGDTSNHKKYKISLGTMFGEVLVLIILYEVSKTGQAGSTFALLIILALWALWSINNPGILAQLTNNLSGGLAGNNPNMPNMLHSVTTQKPVNTSGPPVQHYYPGEPAF